MAKRRSLGALAGALIFCLGLASMALAGPGSVKVTTIGDISIRLGAQVRFVPTSEIDKDFGLSDELTAAQDKKAAAGMRSLGLDVFADSTRVHLTETAGAVKDNYTRTEDRLFFNFSHGKEWDVYMALETDVPIARKSADRTDFMLGRQSQQFGIERLEASFNLPWIYSRFRAGWDARGVDVGYGGFVYADDDPGFGLVGGTRGWKWALWWIRKDETEAVYGKFPEKGLTSTNALGVTNPGRDQDRDFYYIKLGHDIHSAYLEGFYIFNRNRVKDVEIDHHVVGLQGKAAYGIFLPMFEFAYAFGDWQVGSATADIGSWALFGDLAVDLHQMVPLDKFQVHIGAYYVQGDGDTSDDDLGGFAPVVGISRFTPRFGSDSAGIVHDGNPILGQTLYSMFPAYYGQHPGAGINGGGNFDNPGFVMVGGGVTAAEGKWTYITHLMAMWYDHTAPIETDYGDKLAVAGTKIDKFMGVEWDNEVRYSLYKSVTLKGAFSFLFAGDAVRDITQALDAYARGVDFQQGRSTDDTQMRFAGEFIWFF